jgi:GDPmannose 4,6-dehydratase
MWSMLRQDAPDNYVVATGEAHSVRELVEIAFGRLGLDWRQHVEIGRLYLRPTEVDALQGDASKARDRLGWRPKVGSCNFVNVIVEHDLGLARHERALERAGFDNRARGTATGG